MLQYDNEDETIIEIGVDESGLGSSISRVYVGSVILPKGKDAVFDYTNIKDSKKFHSKKKIREVATYIKQHAVAYSICYEDEKTIDKINILQANQQAMHNCIRELVKKLNLDPKKTLLLIDGNRFHPFTTYSHHKKIEMVEHKCIVGGDNIYASIACASILAKVSRDDYIAELCIQYPELITKYSINTNMGYLTQKHMDGIRHYGITDLHRKTFCHKILASSSSSSSSSSDVVEDKEDVM